MDGYLVALGLLIVVAITRVVVAVKVGRLRDPRDEDGRKLPRTDENERRAKRISRIGGAVALVLMLCAAALYVATRPELLPVWLVGAAVIGLVAVIVQLVRRRSKRRRQQESAALDARE